MMVGFEGTELPSFYFDWLKKGLGGVVLFSRNITAPEQLSKLTDEIQYASRPVPALIAADQEGGRVFRLKDPFTHFPTAQIVGKSVVQTGSTDLAYNAARATARELAAMGIRLNFAPVLDVHTNPANPIIGDRAFGEEPDLVDRAAMAVMRGLHDEGVISCGKHFPGHGDTAQDSHLDLPFVKKSAEELRRVEFEPFRRAVHQGIPMLMTAHVMYPNLDADFPATMSEKILLDELRGGMGFDGIIITDDLEMQAIKDRFAWKEVVVRCMNAGVDIILVCKTREIQELIFEALIDGIESKAIKPELVAKALRRVEKLKKKFLKDPRPFPVEQWKRLVGCAEHKALVSDLQRFA